MNKKVQTGTKRAAMGSLRKTSLVAGILYLLTFVSIPTLALYSQVKGANYIIGSGMDTPAIIGGILEIIVALAGIGTAVVLSSGNMYHWQGCSQFRSHYLSFLWASTSSSKVSNLRP